MKKHLETVMTVAVLLMTVAVGITVYRIHALIATVPESREYKVDETVDFLPSGNRISLVLGISPTCSWCKRDIPIYQHIGRSKRVLDGSLTVIDMLPPEAKDTGAQWLKENSIPGKLTLPEKGRKYPFAATPTLILAKGNRIVWVHRGGMIPTVERELFAKLD